MKPICGVKMKNHPACLRWVKSDMNGDETQSDRIDIRTGRKRGDIQI
jgi:hypothetical protein